MPGTDAIRHHSTSEPCPGLRIIINIFFPEFKNPPKIESLWHCNENVIIVINGTQYMCDILNMKITDHFRFFLIHIYDFNPQYKNRICILTIIVE